MKIKKHDFIELDFVGKIKETNEVFDLTREEDAKKYNVYDSKQKYRPAIICVGDSDIVKGLDQQLEEKEVGKEYAIEVTPELGFGKKDAKLIQLIPISVFKKQDIMPYPGLQVTINNIIGTIRTVTGGRIVVDFNHPLAGRTLIYEIKINRIVTDDKEKLEGLLRICLNIPEVKIAMEEGIAKIDLEVPKEAQEKIIEKVKKLIPSIKNIEFKTINKQ